ncbi:Sedlin [Acaromyces ingoldii]|uniref:Sedlin n=1 Tax=Acaromyces ingoldii TaxID=215250 RepID=A0A316YNG6_9BASI|nr:Sedlin [Acaromyces ingoldii]PWN90692.1 Sedlin [Acaromyces ingoldii]
MTSAGGASASSSSAVRIEAVAIVGNKNQRLFLASRASSSSSSSSSSSQAGVEEALRLEHAAHCALDVIDERTQPRSTDQQGPQSTYLGLVLALEDLSIYALITTTRLRILVVLRTPAGAAAVSAGGSAGPGTGTAAGASADAKVRDLDVLTVLRAVHTSYLAYASNPFLALGPGASAGAVAGAGASVLASSLDAASKGSFGHASAPSRAGEIRSATFDRRIRAIAGW